jgi:hypothetical protein
MRDFESLLTLYVDDLTYWSNFGGPDGGPNVVRGKPALLTHLIAYGTMDSLSVPENFRLVNGLGHATSSFYMRHPKTGLAHSGVYRQVASYRDNKILRLEELHDAAASRPSCP